jgi:hypothetical protein
MYNHPIAEEGLAGLPSRIAERSKMGSVNGWIFYGIESIREISRLLTHQPGLDVCLIITVGAAASPKPLSLVYETKMYHPTTYRWLAKNNPLEIKDARFVATRPLGTGEDAHANSHAGSEEKGVAQARPSNSESDWRAKIRSALLR